ncbi:murein transglycosylase A [Roseibium sp. Sym1]|uniref:murein transglycosylase A n=1 Tax=Roseibium sp. Sym1 TaxID=3016006 RepID=UPI0022B30E88|nr:MltA domain-containing protein [Roseibium sp. Sym1]
MADGPQIPDHLHKVAFADLAGWREDDHAAALESFLRLCGKPEVLDASPTFPRVAPGILEALCDEGKRSGRASADAARRFFETWFTPYRVDRKGFVTAYFEPELAASREKTLDYAVPLLKKPDGLEPVGVADRPRDWPAHLSHGRRVNGKLTEMPDRGAIMAGALDEENLELVWLADPVDAFYVHVQGSARLRLADGTVMRVGYAGKTGHPYTGIARLLVERGEGTPEDFTMSGTRAWLEAHPEERDALFRKNRSYIFFREVTEVGSEDGPVGAAGLALSAGRSLAVDPDHIPYGGLVFVGTDFDLPAAGGTFRRLMVADDTGSAIKGPARGDVFVGSGETAGAIAGEIRHPATFTLLVPNLALGSGTVVTD